MMFFEGLVISLSQLTFRNMDWSVCVICSEGGGEDLRCPADSLQKNSAEVYSTSNSSVLYTLRV